MGKLKTKTKVVIISCVSAAVVVAAGSIATYMYFQKKNAPGWHKKDGIAYFNLDNGQKATEIHTIKGKKYYFDKNGNLCTGWIDSENGKYFSNEEGVIQTGIIEDNGNKYCMGQDGKLVTLKEKSIILTKKENFKKAL